MAVIFKQEIFVDKTELEEVEKVLNITEGCAKDYAEDELIARYSAEFHTPYGHFGVDLNVYNADTPYVDPVLFHVATMKEAEIWSELYPLNTEDTLRETFVFPLNKGEDIELHVEVLEKPETK